MTALAAARVTPVRRGDNVRKYDVKGSVKIWQGGLVVLDSTGYARPGRASTTDLAVGRAESTVDNTAGADGALTIYVRSGEFRYANSAAGDAITRTEITKTCYIVDDQTVAKTNGGSTRSAAGLITQVDASGVWVAIGPGGVL